MKKNISNIDKGIRILLAIAFAVLYFTGTLSGVLGIVLMVVSGVFVLTSLAGSCPLYSLFGISTCAVPKNE